MRRFAAYQAAKANDRVEAAGLCGAPCRHRDLEGAGHPQNGNVVLRQARRLQRLDRAGLQLVGDKVVVTRHDDSNLQTISHTENYFPLNWAARFSRNARVPSRMSSVAATR